MLHRLGSSLILIGLIFLIVFLVTYQAGDANTITLLAGLVMCIFGLLFRRRGRPRRDLPPARFRAVRKLLSKIETEEE